jgi:hypothetical protein
VIVRRVVAVIINSEQQKTLLKNPSRGFHFFNFFFEKTRPYGADGRRVFFEEKWLATKKRINHQ